MYNINAKYLVFLTKHPDMIDDIIMKAFMNTPIQGEGLFIVEGNPEKDDLRILPADDAFKDNINCFIWDINTGYLFLGIFVEERLAQDYLEAIRYGRDKDTLFQSESLFVVEGNPRRNELKVETAHHAFNTNLTKFELGTATGYQYMGIFTREQLAHDYIVLIRRGLRNEEGTRLI